MADQKSQTSQEPLIREYTIPLRRHWINVPRYERTGKAIKAIKKFIAKHMKVPERDINKVKLDVYLNNDIWFRGSRKPPAKIKVRAIKENDIVKVEFFEIPQHVKFLKAKDQKFRKAAEKPKEEKKEAKDEERKEETKTEEQKKDEKEKETSVAEQRMKEIKQEVKAEKHATTFDKKKTQPRS